MSYPFTKELDVKLIRCVKKYPLIYDPSSVLYLNSDEKTVAWEKISDEIKVPAHVAKSRWINIRDIMRKKIKERLWRKDRVKYKYKYESELQYLAEIIIKSIEEKSRAISPDNNTEADFVTFSISEDHDVKPDVNQLDVKNVEFEHCDLNVNDSCTNMDFSADDTLNGFLMTIGSTMKNFSPYYLNQAKSKIFSIVQEFELKQIVENEKQSNGTVST